MKCIQDEVLHWLQANGHIYRLVAAQNKYTVVQEYTGHSIGQLAGGMEHHQKRKRLGCTATMQLLSSKYCLNSMDDNIVRYMLTCCTPAIFDECDAILLALFRPQWYVSLTTTTTANNTPPIVNWDPAASLNRRAAVKETEYFNTTLPPPEEAILDILQSRLTRQQCSSSSSSRRERMTISPLALTAFSPR